MKVFGIVLLIIGALCLGFSRLARSIRLLANEPQSNKVEAMLFIIGLILCGLGFLLQSIH